MEDKQKQLKIKDILINPDLLKGKTPDEVQRLLGEIPREWQVEKLRRGSQKGRGWVLRKYRTKGDPTRGAVREAGPLIRYHPGGSHHGQKPYWRVSDGNTKSGIIPADSESKE